MATSSFSREFVISNPQSVEKLITSLENPTKIKLEKRDAITEQQNKQKIVCKLQAHLASMNLYK